MALVPQVSLALGASKVQALAHSTVLLVTQVIEGGVVSVTITVWLHVLLLPQRSLALHVRVATKVLPQVALVTVPMTLMVTLVASHTSVAVGLVKAQAVPHSTVEFGVQVIVGAVVSITVTVWLHM